MNSALEIFSIGIGPSSSHTIGPMKAANNFINLLTNKEQFNLISNIKVSLYGSLALTGDGHGTIMAIINGLCGNNPKTTTKDDFLKCYFAVKTNKKLNLPQHPNGMRFEAFSNNTPVLSCDFFSIGGGFVLSAAEINGTAILPAKIKLPYPFTTAKELFTLCAENNLTVAELVFKNELFSKSKEQIATEVFEIADVMYNSIQSGINASDDLPGGLNIPKRAKLLYQKIQQSTDSNTSEYNRSLAMAYAIAVNEENASFGKVVTAPTNGAAGTIPAVLEYYKLYNCGISNDKVLEFILTAAAIGMLYKIGASISAAEVGCQGEIGAN